MPRPEPPTTQRVVRRTRWGATLFAAALDRIRRGIPPWPPGPPVGDPPGKSKRAARVIDTGAATRAAPVSAAQAPLSAAVHQDAACAPAATAVAPGTGRPADRVVQGTPSLAFARKGAVAWTNRLLAHLLPKRRHLMAGLREQARAP